MTLFYQQKKCKSSFHAKISVSNQFHSRDFKCFCSLFKITHEKLNIWKGYRWTSAKINKSEHSNKKSGLKIRKIPWFIKINETPNLTYAHKVHSWIVQYLINSQLQNCNNNVRLSVIKDSRKQSCTYKRRRYQSTLCFRSQQSLRWLIRLNLIENSVRRVQYEMQPGLHNPVNR